MKPLPQDIKRFFIALIAIGIVGGGSVLWIHQKLTDARMDLYQMTQKIESLQRQGAKDFNLEQLKKNEEAANDALKRVEPILTASSELIKTAQDMSVEGWKKLLNEKLSSLTKMPLNNCPKDFFYGFANFKQNMPEAGDVFHLSVQLLATEELCEILFDTKFAGLKTVRRAPVEKNISEKSDFSDEKMESQEFYFSYPFELEFSCKPEGLRRFLNGILASKFLFVPKSIEVENFHNPQQAFSDILKGNKNRSIFVISGEEDIQVKMKVNFLLWKM